MRYRLHGVELDIDADLGSWPTCQQPSADPWRVQIDHTGAELIRANLVRSGNPEWTWTGDPTSTADISTLTVTGGPGEGSATTYRLDWNARTIDIAYTHAATGGYVGVIELLNRWVVPMIARSTATDLPLHATTVMADGHAVLIAGDSGAGKSTLTAALVDAGALLLGDEPAVLRVGGAPLALWPGEAGVRLHNPHQITGLTRETDRFGKAVYTATAPLPGDHPIPVKAICLLGQRHSGEGFVVTPLPTDTALTDVMAQRYTFPGAPEVIRSDFPAAVKVAGSARVVWLSTPDTVERLHACAAHLWGVLNEALS